MLITSPNTDEALVVEQFQRSFSNCFWHSVIPSLAPCFSVGIRSGLFWHTLICCEDKSGTPSQVDKLPLLRVLSAEIPIHLKTRQETFNMSKSRRHTFVHICPHLAIKLDTLLFLILVNTKRTKRKKN